jgi:hypothetical protein
MGEANLAFARGETNKAIDICTEVIKHGIYKKHIFFFN